MQAAEHRGTSWSSKPGCPSLTSVGLSDGEGLMSAPNPEQRNPYKGAPPRSWVRITLVAADGAEQAVELLADTGAPDEVIISEDLMDRFGRRAGLQVPSNFGLLNGGWLRVRVPDLGFDA